MQNLAHQEGRDDTSWPLSLWRCCASVQKTGRFPLAASCHVQLRRPAVAAGSSGREQRKQQEPPAKDRADEISKGEVEEDGGARPLRGLLIPSYLILY